ncbi:hypothetical protein PRIPAC_97686 [Pristionchus pacificus]|uniref:Uncharacterized protein n=1 Tax=Pristionchus pacificus TaxID=54126 RepID=A0A2A6BC84_PRIPA|nr:hypothetical protein PRIPAC_97686 [Pristionchus pacificus]|eukprot:PDM63503.1 hypothetical protein PRIPAC_53860 [Pristionchus pacificus]
MSTNPLASDKNEYSLLKEEDTSLNNLFNMWCSYFSGLLAILQMVYGIGLVLFFFLSFDVNYEKWEIPLSMVLTMVFTGFIVQASALLIIVGHIKRNSQYVYMGCIFPFLECSRTSYIVFKRVYEVIFEDRGRGPFFLISLVFHFKTASIIEKDDENEE